MNLGWIPWKYEELCAVVCEIIQLVKIGEIEIEAVKTWQFINVQWLYLGSLSKSEYPASLWATISLL